MKRIVNHLKENWIKYGFETLVVVAGVLGAFALNNWNEQNKIIKLERKVIKELADEFRINQEKLTAYINYLDERKQPTLAIYKMYSLDPEKFDINEFDSLLAATFLYKSF